MRLTLRSFLSKTENNHAATVRNILPLFSYGTVGGYEGVSESR